LFDLYSSKIPDRLGHASNRGGAGKDHGGIAVDIESLTAVMKKYPWAELQKLKGDQVTLEKIEEAHSILENHKDALS
jgi:hypothetical protein